MAYLGTADSTDTSRGTARTAGTGLVTGSCALTPHAAPDLTVTVAAGYGCIGKVPFYIPGGKVSFRPADPHTARRDTIYADPNTGKLSVVEGAQAAEGTMPTKAALVSGLVYIGEVYVDARYPGLDASTQVLAEDTPLYTSLNDSGVLPG